MASNEHIVSLCNREELTLTGIVDVEAFDNETISAISECGDILIKGENLNVEELDLKTGSLKITGKVSAIVYSEHSASKGFFKRVFS